MCGIVYFNNTNGKSANKLVKGAYKAQRSSGHEGFGFFTPNNNKLTHNTNERNIMRLLKRTKQSEILFHHRFPTSTANVRNACHPFSTKTRYKHNYVMVHNGVIWNDNEIAKEQQINGVSYVSRQKDGRINDSEVLLYDLADFIEGETDKLSVYGSIAFVMVQLDKKGNRKALYFGRNEGSPLKIKNYNNGFSLTSEGDGTMVLCDKLFKYDYKTKVFSSTEMKIPNWNSNKYDYYDKYGNDLLTGYRSNAGTTFNDDASELYESYTNPESSVFTENVLDRYKAGDPTSLKFSVDEVKNALLYDMNESLAGAIELGEYLLEGYSDDMAEAEDILRNGESLTGLELDEYIELDYKVKLLNTAIKELSSRQLNLQLRS